MTQGTKKGNYIGQGWLVILLALIYGGGLAGVQIMLGEKITENKKNETYSVIPELVPGADKTKTEGLMLTGKNGKEALVYKALSSSGDLVGWVIPAGGQGFADRIEVLIGVDENVDTITGFFVLEQKETPGLGDYIKGKDFTDRFKEKPTDEPLVVVKREPTADNEIRALTGATISSESVSAIVNSALANLKVPILEKKG